MSPSPCDTGPDPSLLECVANVSEGRDPALIEALARSCGDVLLDVHADPDHHRSVFTLAGPGPAVEEAVRHLARTAIARLQLPGHDGAHPRLGVLDVVPFVALGDTPFDTALAARDSFCQWAAASLELPCFRYGPMPDRTERTLPQVRHGAFSVIPPDAGPARPHPTAGATAVGARPILVAYNVWLEGDGATGPLARAVARSLRGPAVRALGFELAHGVQVSCNLIDPVAVGPADVFDAVASRLEGSGATIARAELVGLVPVSVLARVPAERWVELDLGMGRTIEQRMDAAKHPRAMTEQA